MPFGTLRIAKTLATTLRATRYKQSSLISNDKLTKNMTDKPYGYRNKTLIDFWKSERLPFLFAFPVVIGLGVSGFLIISSFQKGLANLIGGLFFLGFISIGYIVYFSSMYGLYRKGHLLYSSIKGYKKILTGVKIYNGNVDPKFVGYGKLLDKGLSLPIYDFNKADIILTDYSMILLGVPSGLTNVKYLAPIELIFNDKWTDYSSNRAMIIDYENNSDRVVLHINDDNYKKTIKINIKSETEIIKQWLTRNILKPGDCG